MQSFFAIRRTVAAVLLGLSATFPFAAPLRAQYPVYNYPDCKGTPVGLVTPPDILPSGDRPAIRPGAPGSPEVVDRLRDYLRKPDQCELAWIRPLLFGKTYTPRLVDWIVYVDTNRVVQGWTWKNRLVGMPIFRNEKYLFMELFINGPLQETAAPRNPKHALYELLSLLSDDTLTLSRVKRVRKAYFQDDGRIDSAAQNNLLSFTRELMDVSGLGLGNLGSGTESNRKALDRLTDSDLVAAEGFRQTIVPREKRRELSELRTLLTTGTLPPLPLAYRAGSSEAEHVVRQVLNYLTDPANADRLAAARNLIAGKSDAEPSGPDSIQVFRDVVQFQRDPILSKVLGLASKLFGGASSDNTAPRAIFDSTLYFRVQDLGPGTIDTTHLYLAFGKVPIGEEMWGRLNVYAPKGKQFPKTQSVLTNFINTTRSRFGVSVGVGFLTSSRVAVLKSRVDSIISRTDTIRPDTLIKFPSDTFKTRVHGQEGAVFDGDSYALLHLRLANRRPWPTHYRVGPVWYESMGIFVGTNLLEGTIGDRVPMGFSFDRLWGSELGLALGGVRIPHLKNIKTKPEEAHTWRPFLAVTLQL